MAVVAFIPARGGSKSIPLKNIKSFCGKPLIYWNIEALSRVNRVDEIVVATDSDEIESTVRSFNIPNVNIYRRSMANAGDTASTESVMLEFLDHRRENLLDQDIFVLAQLTNPFTRAKDFEEGLNLMFEADTDSVISCARIKRFFWNEAGVPENYDYLNRPRRQDFKGTLVENGAFYINKVGNIKHFQNRLSGKIKVFEMPEYTQLEIDEPHDWVIAEGLFKATVYRDFFHGLSEKLQKIRIVLSDVDGVLTDAGMYYSEKGDELKKFNTRDGKGFELLRRAGFKTGIITTENTEMVNRRVKKLKLDYIYQGVAHLGKLGAIKEICHKENLDLDQVAYIGDDINCREALQHVGFAACPADADPEIKALPNIYPLALNGGQGVLRELSALLLSFKE